MIKFKIDILTNSSEYGLKSMRSRKNYFCGISKILVHFIIYSNVDYLIER